MDETMDDTMDESVDETVDETADETVRWDCVCGWEDRKDCGWDLFVDDRMLDENMDDRVWN
jgi:hypothetical protein